jgi:hypothetical protein
MPHMGRGVSCYDPKLCALARNYAKLGATDVQVAEFLGIAQSTLYVWKAQYEDFAAALAEGKVSADDQVVRSLFQRATGYKHVAFKILQHEGRAFTKRYVEHYPPDVAACIFWLKNRKRDEWRDVRQHDVNGKVTLEDLVAGPKEAEKSDG